MTKSCAKLRPVQVGRYRYSKLRWRLLVRALDSLGTIAVAIFRRFRPVRPVTSPRRVLVVQLDHLGDAVLSTPLIAELRLAYPEAAIDVLASPSNHEVFEADPNVDRVWVAERTWFERRPDRWALVTAVWSLGRSLRRMGYDLGIDVRGDVLTVVVLALAGVTPPCWLVHGRRGLPADRRRRLDSRPARGPLAASPSVPTGDRPGRVGAGGRPRDRRGPGRRRTTARRRLAPPHPRRRVGPRSRFMPRPGADGCPMTETSARLAQLRTGRRRGGLAARRSILAAAPASGRPPRGRQRGQALAAPVLEGPGRAVPRRRMAGRRRRGDRRPSAFVRPRAPRPPPRLGRDALRSPRPPRCWSGPTSSSGPIPDRPTWRLPRARSRSSSSAGPTNPGNGAPGRGIRSPSATASPASLATRRSARSPATPACRAWTPTASTEAPCDGGPARTARSRPTHRCDRGRDGRGAPGSEFLERFTIRVAHTPGARFGASPTRA